MTARPSSPLLGDADLSTIDQVESSRVPEEDVVRALVEQLPDVVVVHRDFRILYVNRACVELLGYDGPEDFIGRDLLDFLHPDDREATIRVVQETDQALRSTPARELRVLHRDGTVMWMDLAPVHHVHLPDGPARLAVGRDRTAQRKLKEHLVETERLGSLGVLAGGVAHQLSNPLTYVLGNLVVIGEALSRWGGGEVPDAAELTDAHRALADAREGAERMRDLIADLKVFARPDLGRRTVLDLPRVLDSAINMAWPEVHPRARLVRDYGLAPPVRAVESKLALAIYHLVTNAAQAIERGHADTEHVCVRLGTALDGRARIDVEDTGRGVPEEVRDRVWDPFFTTRPGGTGAGLGLPVVASVIAAVGGEVELLPRPEGGTVVRVSLPPAGASPQIAARRRLVDVPEEDMRYGRILVVDDQAVIGALVRRALEGHDVYIVGSGRDALELVGALDLDVMICDLVMPDLDGMEIHAALAERHPAMLERTLFMTAGPVSPEQREFLDQVKDRVLDKPFEFAELRRAVQHILQSR